MDEKIAHLDRNGLAKAKFADLKIEDLVKLLRENFACFSNSATSYIETLDSQGRQKTNNSSFPLDVLDLHTELLSIPSTYISDMLGGSPEQSVTDRLRGIGRLQLICSMARSDGKLVLEIPDHARDRDCYVDPLECTRDPALLRQLPIMQGYFRSSEQGRNILGDASGFPVLKLWELRRDLQYFMHENASRLIVRELPPEYASFSTDARTPYQGAMTRLIQDVFHKFSNHARLMSEALSLINVEMNGTLKVNVKEKQSKISCCDVRFDDLSLYTALVLREYFYDLIGLDSPLAQSIASITDTLGLLVESVIPELCGLMSTNADLAKLEAFVHDSKEWWKKTSFLLIKNSSRKDLSTVGFLKENLPSVLLGNIKKPVEALDKLVAKISAIMAMHPSDKSDSSKSTCALDASSTTPIHLFSLKLLQVLQRLLRKLEAIIQFMGEVDDRGMCIGEPGFINIYAALRSMYICRHKNEFSEGAGPQALVLIESPRHGLNSSMNHADNKSLDKVPLSSSGSPSQPATESRQRTGASPPRSAVSSTAPSARESPREMTAPSTPNSTRLNRVHSGGLRVSIGDGAATPTPPAKLSPRQSPNHSPRAISSAVGTDPTFFASPGADASASNVQLRSGSFAKRRGGEGSLRRRSTANSTALRMGQESTEVSEQLTGSAIRAEESNEAQSSNGIL